MTHLKGLPFRVVAIEMAAGGDAQPPTVRRPRYVWYQRTGAMVTTARCTESRADMTV